VRLSFSETMRGTLGAHPVEFTVTARAEGLGFFTLDGTVKAQPWAEGAVVGSLHLTLGALSYRLNLPNGFVLTAKKTPSLFHPLRSMTWMPAKLTDSAGAVVAEGEMTFALRELPAFVLSALPVPR
jgi:hypothetical protein